MEPSERYNASRRITLLGAAKNAFLATIKIIFGITGHSHALFADGIHSLSDLIIDGVVLIASRFGSKGADSDHPYGHRRIETAATVLLAFILSLAGVGIIFDAGLEVYGARATTPPSFYVMIVALASVLINEILYRYTRRVGERIQSTLLVTNAWHHRSDSGSSLVVLIGAGAAWFGIGVLDAIAAVIVGIMILKMAWQFGWSSIRELVDTGLEVDVLTKIKETINSVPGVREVHQLRTRSLGGTIYLDVHIMVDSYISVSEGHFISNQVHLRLMKEVPGVVDVTVHIDPENDEVASPSSHLPARAEVMRLLQEHWQDLLSASAIKNTTLHYLDGKIHIELHLPLNLCSDEAAREKLAQQLQQAIDNNKMIGSLKVLFG